LAGLPLHVLREARPGAR